jgi:hypothetical protein
MSAYEDWPDVTDAEPWVKVNQNNRNLGQAWLFAHKESADTGLFVGIGGGDFEAGEVLSDVAIECADDDANYIVADRATGEVSADIATTDWDNTTDFGRIAIATFAGGVLTFQDQRYLAGGIFDQAAATGGGDAQTANPLSQFAATTSAQLRGVISDETGGGLAVFNDAPTLIDPVVGTQSAGDSTTKAASTAFVAAAVAAAVAGLSWKQAVRAATTAAGTLASSFENGDAIDGVTLATGDRILIKNQASASENGIYVVAASGAPARASDADSGAELVNASVYVSEGTTLADTQWTCTTNATITVGSTSIAFAQLASGGAGMATDTLWDAAGDLAVGTGSNTGGRLALGTARQSLRVNGVANAVEWFSDVQCIPIACGDETTALTAGTAKVTFRMPFAFKLTDVRASVTTAPTGGTLLTVDVNEAGSTILSTKLTFDASEKTTTTASTPRVISDSDLADDAEITIDVDAVGSTIAGAGLKVYLIGYPA